MKNKRKMEGGGKREREREHLLRRTEIGETES